MSKLYNYVNGKFCAPTGNKTTPVVNPSTEEVLFNLPLSTSEDVDVAVQAAEKAFDSYSSWSKEQRVDLMKKVVEEYKNRSKDLAKAISDEMGAPLDFALAAQVGIGLTHLQTFVEEIKEYPFEETRGKAKILREPIGVVGLITPWNWPMNQITLKVGAALSVGCTMVLKPSEFTPTSAVIFAEVLHNAGVPAGVFNLVQGLGPEVGVAISSHPRISMVSFTGSTKAGIDVAQKGALTVKRVSQELGGKSANIILDDDTFETGVKRGTKHCFGNCGQSCNAPTRMLVPIHRMDEAAKIAAEVAASTTNGPVVNKIQWEKIQALIQKGIDEGAKLVAGGVGRVEPHKVGFFIRPTVFSHATNSMTIASEEIFGPVLSIIGYKTEEEAVQIANDTPYGLAGYVWGKSSEKTKNIARKIRAGNVSINGTDFEPRAPFGGYKTSGNGREMGSFGFDDMVEIKAVVGYSD